jgi:hypothetical protein
MLWQYDMDEEVYYNPLYISVRKSRNPETNVLFLRFSW